MKINERVLPSDIKAEEAVIGTILAFPEAADTMAEDLEPENFFLIANQHIFKAIKFLIFNREKPTIVAVNNRLQQKGKEHEAGGFERIIKLAKGNFLSLSNFPQYVRLIKKKFLYRELIKKLERCLEIAYDPITEEAEELVSIHEESREIAARIANPDKNRYEQDIEPAHKMVQNMYKHEEAIQSGKTVRAISTGIKQLDDYIGGGAKPGEIIILFGDSKAGKSTVALNIAMNMAQEYYQKTGKETLYFSLEMTSLDVTYKMVSQASGVSCTNIMQGEFNSKEEVEKFQAGAQQFASTGFNLYSKSCSAHDIASIINFDGGRKYGAVFIDHSLLLSSPFSKPTQDTEMIAESLKILKELAKNQKIPIILLCHIGKNIANKQDKTPTKEDIFGSSKFTMYAGAVIGLYRPGQYNKEIDSSYLQLLILANRFGPADGIIECEVNLKINLVTSPYKEAKNFPEQAKKYVPTEDF